MRKLPGTCNPLPFILFGSHGHWNFDLLLWKMSLKVDSPIGAFIAKHQSISLSRWYLGIFAVLVLIHFRKSTMLNLSPSLVRAYQWRRNSQRSDWEHGPGRSCSCSALVLTWACIWAALASLFVVTIGSEALGHEWSVTVTLWDLIYLLLARIPTRRPEKSTASHSSDLFLWEAFWFKL